jgi:hypothetical protein
MAYRMSYVVWTVHASNHLAMPSGRIPSACEIEKAQTDKLKLPVMSIEKNETPVFLHLRDRYSLGGVGAPE